MAKRNSHQLTQPQLEIPVVIVPCQFREQQAAFLLGARDAFCKSRIERTFAFEQTETAYAAGVVAGIMARRTTKR